MTMIHLTPQFHTGTNVPVPAKIPAKIPGHGSGGLRNHIRQIDITMPYGKFINPDKFECRQGNG